MDNDDNEHEDDEILMAASAWASALDQDGDDGIRSTDDIKSEVNVETTKKKSIKDKGNETNDNGNNTQYNVNSLSSTKNTSATWAARTITAYSLHLKNVPYDASQSDIRFAFLQKRCNVTSVRLVYDQDQKTGEKHFRGVAFVDLADEESYHRGISELHNKTFLGKGRRVSVRPTRTKSELSDIVRRTEEKVANLIARSKELKKDDDGRGAVVGGGVDKDDSIAHGTTKNDKKKKKKRRRSEGADIDVNESSTADNKSSTDCKKSTRGSATGSGRKKQKKEMETSAAPKRLTKSNATTGPKLPEQLYSGDADETLVSPGSKKSEKKAKSGEANPKHGKSSRTKSEESPPIIKLTKKQRAKKAAVLRMLKVKGMKS